jgi:hypothetical protein
MRLPVRLALLFAAALPLAARAGTNDVPCGTVEIRFQPSTPRLQIVVWIEDANGKVVDTPYITALTGTFGLANRPGAALLKTDCGWPYGRRTMVMPVWAHRRNHHYPYVIMGGACGNSPTSSCPHGGLCGGDCVDSTIAYHSLVSSYEPYYCGPGGGSKCPDVVTCASKGTFSKGAYVPGMFSLYPPRADLDPNSFNANTDSMDILDFAKQNDLNAVSQATPLAHAGDPPVAVDWYPQAVGLPTGDYVAWIEMSQEADFNQFNNHPNMADSVQQWDFEGHTFLGQPSILYDVPFHYDATGYSAIATSYAGYSTWDGSDGVLHPDDGTITTNAAGTGAGRLGDVNDGIDVYRMKVVVGSCIAPPPDMAMGDGGPVDAGAHDGGGGGGPDLAMPIPTCETPEPITDLVLTPHSQSISVAFRSPASGVAPNRYAVRYKESTDPITDANFDAANPALSLMMASAPGAPVAPMEIPSLTPQRSYAVAVRGISPCGKVSKVVSTVTRTDQQQFAVLHGCFIATAAWGSPMARSVAALRAFRDRRLLVSPGGALLVATYYAFSPPLADLIAADDRLRAATRSLLAPLVSLVESAP